MAEQAGLAVYGGFNGTETNRAQHDWVANPTVLSGNIGAGLAAQVVLADGNTAALTDTARLDGFIIEQGQVGLRVQFGAAPLIENCLLRTPGSLDAHRQRPGKRSAHLHRPQTPYTVFATTNPGVPSRDWIELGPMSEPVPGIYEFTDPDPTQPRPYDHVRSP